MFTKPVSFQDGPSFCHYCVTLCPVNRTVSGGTLVGNIAVEGAISRRIIKCPSTISLPGGCNWTGPTGSLENHLPHRNMKIVGYNYEGRGCILCSYQHELPQHLLICPHWTEKCPPPPLVWTFHIMINQAMMSCVSKLVPCLNSCGIQVER